jgi:hypothetical protein
VSPQPGITDDRRSVYEGSGLLSPAQLGVKAGGLFDVFRTKRDDTVPFVAEPTRESLTMPPAGYQTPAANHAYGITEQEKYKLLGGPPPGTTENPSGILPPGKF